MHGVDHFRISVRLTKEQNIFSPLPLSAYPATFSVCHGDCITGSKTSNAAAQNQGCHAPIPPHALFPLVCKLTNLKKML